MAGSGYAVSRMRRPGAAAAVWAVLLAAVITLLGLVLPGGEQGRTSGALWLAAGTEPASTQSHRQTAEPASAQSHRQSAEPASAQAYVETAEPALFPDAVRSQGDVTGERHAPLGAVPCPTPLAATVLFRLTQPMATAEDPTSLPALGHGVRAPPSPSGI